MTVKKDVSLVGNGELVAAKLTPQQRRFCEEYMLDLCGAAAAVRANYSPDSAKETACRLLTNNNVRAYIDIMLAERSTRTGVNADRIVRELARISFANPAKVIAEDGSISPDASEDDLSAIQSIKVKVTHSKSGITTEKEVRFHDKAKSLELLGRHLAMFIDKKQIDITTKIEDYTDEERIRRILELQKEIPINITPIPGDDEA